MFLISLGLLFLLGVWVCCFLSTFFFFLHLLLLLLSAFFVASGFGFVASGFVFVVFVFFTAASLNFVHYGNRVFKTRVPQGKIIKLKALSLNFKGQN